MDVLNVKTNTNEYSVCIAQGLSQNLPKSLNELYPGSRFAIISDTNVLRIYGENIKQGFDSAGLHYGVVSIKPGEKSKSIRVFSDIVSRLAQDHYNRADVIVALGGGIVGDLAGFVAATYLRGIRYVQVPTTLLAQIDSSVGGKTAVNLHEGKNLVGAFYQPSAVFIDTDFLKTLKDKDFADGMAEMIKYAMIKDKEMLNVLENSSINAHSNKLKDLIIRCLKIKRDIVSADEKDMGERMLLNFGHTIGHGIERVSATQGIPISHGHAVACGMAAITAGSERAGQTKPGTAKRIADLLKKANLPFSIDGFDKNQILKGILVDKKNVADKLNIILLKEPGCAFIYSIQKKDMDIYI
ncbi:MAG: 3-dehydroquinate synthase [Christensenellales bacterium]|jgi:3-dehydroquinate synthase